MSAPTRPQRPPRDRLRELRRLLDGVQERETEDRPSAAQRASPTPGSCRRAASACAASAAAAARRPRCGSGRTVPPSRTAPARSTPLHELERLLVHGAALRRVRAVGEKLVRDAAEEADDGAPARDRVEDRELLRCPDRVRQRQDDPEHRDLHVRIALAYSGRHHDRVRRELRLRVVVLGDGEPVEPVLGGDIEELEPLRDRVGADLRVPVPRRRRPAEGQALSLVAHRVEDRDLHRRLLSLRVDDAARRVHDERLLPLGEVADDRGGPPPAGRTESRGQRRRRRRRCN